MKFATVKEKPEAPEGHVTVTCPKCGGTGFFCLYVENGKPKSNTGFCCHQCNGVGYTFRKKRVKKEVCPRCGWRQPVGEPHYFTRELPDGSWGPVECK